MTALRPYGVGSLLSWKCAGRWTSALPRLSCLLVVLLCHCGLLCPPSLVSAEFAISSPGYCSPRCSSSSQVTITGTDWPSDSISVTSCQAVLTSSLGHTYTFGGSPFNRPSGVSRDSNGNWEATGRLPVVPWYETQAQVSFALTVRDRNSLNSDQWSQRYDGAYVYAKMAQPAGGDAELFALTGAVQWAFESGQTIQLIGFNLPYNNPVLILSSQYRYTCQPREDSYSALIVCNLPAIWPSDVGRDLQLFPTLVGGATTTHGAIIRYAKSAVPGSSPTSSPRSPLSRPSIWASRGCDDTKGPSLETTGNCRGGETLTLVGQRFCSTEQASIDIWAEDGQSAEVSCDSVRVSSAIVATCRLPAAPAGLKGAVMQLSMTCQQSGRSDAFVAFTYAAASKGGEGKQLTGLEQGLIAGVAVAGLIVAVLVALLWRSMRKGASEAVRSEGQAVLMPANKDRSEDAYSAL